MIFLIVVFRLILDLVLKLLTLAPESDDVKLVSEELQGKIETIKAIASSYKKPGTTSAD